MSELEASPQATVTFDQALGKVLKQIRNDKRLSGEEVVARMPSGIRVSTLFGYERGYRQCTAARLVEISEALGVEASDVLGLALQLHRGAARPADSIRVDLFALMRHGPPNLRSWARLRFEAEVDESGITELNEIDINHLILSLRYSRTKLVAHLTGFQFPPSLDDASS